MKAKRKRACRKLPGREPAVKKAAALAQNDETANTSGEAANQNEEAFLKDTANQNEEAFLNFIHQNNKENCISADSNDLGAIHRIVSEADGAKNSSSSSSSSSDSHESFSTEESSSESSVDRRSRKSAKGLRKRNKKASKLPKKAMNGDVKSSRILRSSSKMQNKSMMPQQDPQYNNNELNASLEVIKKVMKMDEAQPFNVPVDPVALGKPDYFNVIDTPMNFGTICSNLENNMKYMNSKDVFNDVQYIWENCCKCNKKGEYIVYLMKRVKKKFMKYWIAAGLCTEKSRKMNERTSNEPSTTDYAIRHGRHEPFYPLGHAVDGASHRQQNKLDFNLPYQHFPPSSYSQSHQLQQPPPSTAWPQFSQLPPVNNHQPSQSQYPQPSTNKPQSSRLQTNSGYNIAGNSLFEQPKGIALKHEKHTPVGYSHIQPPNETALKHKKHASASKYKRNSSKGPLASKYDRQPSHSDLQQPQSSHNHPNPLHQYQHNNSQLRTSQVQAVTDDGNSHLPPQTNYTRSSKYGNWRPVDPVVVAPGQSHPQQYPLSHGQSSGPQNLQPRASHSPPHSSHLRANGDDEHAHSSLSDSALRGINCALRYSASPNIGDRDQLGPIIPPFEQTPDSQVKQNDLVQLPKKKRGRGPTRCHFLDDLAEGERISAPFNQLGQPIGPEAFKLSSFLGTIARNGNWAPLNHVHWRAMPYSFKENMWEYVQTKFDIDPSGKSWVMQSIATKWRDWKADLKAAYYDTLKTDVECLKVNDPRVVPEQWPSLIAYWNSDDTKKRCATNKANRAKQKGAHTSGTKSYARICEEERNKRPDGKELTRAELYILTHTRKNGEPVDETAAAHISKLRKQTAKKLSSSCSDESIGTFSQVMGKEKCTRVRTDTVSATRADVVGLTPNHNEVERMAAEVKRSENEEVRKMVVKVEAMEEKYALMEANIARMASNMEKFLKKIGGSSNILGSEQSAAPVDDS